MLKTKEIVIFNRTSVYHFLQHTLFLINSALLFVQWHNFLLLLKKFLKFLQISETLDEKAVV
jgi:hypothetical protein